MLWLAILGAILLWSAEIACNSQRSQAYQITPKPCWVDGRQGTCMFVFECIKSQGYHIGMCVDTFMFGSCCSHNITSNAMSHQDGVDHSPQVLYTATSQQIVTKKPVNNHYSISSSSSSSKATSRPRPAQQVAPPGGQRPASSPRQPTPPPRHSLRPVAAAMSTDALSPAVNSIPSGYYTKPGWHATTEPNFITSMNYNSIQSGAKPGTSWQYTTEPGFVTRVKKPSSFKPKQKPSKKPISISTNKISFKPTKPAKPTTTKTSTPADAAGTSTSGPEPSTVASVTPTSASEPNASDDKGGCGVPRMSAKPQTRIVGGKDAPFGRWPWQVSVRRTSFFGFSSTHRCGGAVLNENWIATAGHCVDDLLTSQIRIRVGEYDFSSVQEELPYVERSVARKIVHPKYNFFTYEYDLALVQLDKPLEFAAHISPICLPASDDLLVGENATVTGWGRLTEGGTLPSVLQEVQVPIVSNDRCKSMFLRAGRHEFIPEIFLCAGHEGGGQDSCQGDSGGPLQVKGKDGRYFLAGIISWGIGCAEANLPGVCTRISKFVPWILKNVT